MDNNIIFWIWLQCCLGADNSHIHNIFDIFSDAIKIYLSDEKELTASGVFTSKELLKLKNKNLDTAKKIYNNSCMLGYDIFSLQDKNYPELLKNIPTPPVVIYVKGKIPSKDRLFVAMVGTRHSSFTGKKTAFSLSYDLAKNGAVVVSGGALGIDMQAHTGAIMAGGETVCVMGCGINYNYLTANKNLRDEISKHGALISEYPPDYPPAKYTFPKRNRIISGMSDCTVVIEAGKTSGALITAQDAVKQHRTVFAVPGSVENASSLGSNLLIKEGAKTLLDFNDILEWYKASGKNNVNKITVENIEKIRRLGNKKVKSKKEKVVSVVHNNYKDKSSKNNLSDDNADIYNKKEVNGKENENKILHEMLTENASAVYDTISDTPIHVDEIKTLTNLKINEVLSALTELEMNGLVTLHSGRRYIRK